jgi:hypothetical protein
MNILTNNKNFSAIDEIIKTKIFMLSNRNGEADTIVLKQNH